MPIFEFDCPDCGARFDVLVRRSDESVACPECGSASVTRRLSTFAATTGSSGNRGAAGNLAAGPRPPAPT